MNNLKTRDSNLELLRVICIISIIAGHFVESSGVAVYNTLLSSLFFTFFSSLASVSCTVFVIIGAWFLVDMDFKFHRIAHIWLTTITYLLILVLSGKLLGLFEVDATRLYFAFFPVEQEPLWFVGCYIVLLLFSPVLNMLIKERPQRELQLVIIIFAVIMVIYSTVTQQEGFFLSNIWTFIFVYILVGYIKKYGKVCSFKFSTLVFLIVWIAVCLVRGGVSYALTIYPSRILGMIQSYSWFYYLRRQSLPNLLLAFSIFFIFFNLPAFHSKIINMVSGTTLGIYCFHECPGWKEYLWYKVFKTQEFGMNAQSELSRIGYSIFCVLTVLLLGVVIELIRARASKIAIEDRNWYKNFNKKIDDWVNGTVEVSNKQLATFVAKISVAFALYCLLIKVIVLFV